MKSWGLRRYTVAMGAAALLAGCGGASPSIGAPSAMLESRVIPTYAGPSRPWMLPDSKGKNLLYAASSDIVDVYTYPDGKLIGSLGWFNGVGGLCVNRAGDVFIPVFYDHKVYELIN